MKPIVLLDSHTGDMTRFEGRTATHRASYGEPVAFTKDLVEDFRKFPDPKFYVGPTIGPQDPSPGGSPVAVRVAA